MHEEWIMSLKNVRETVCSMEIKGFNNAACVVLAVQKLDQVIQSMENAIRQNGVKNE